MIGNAIGAAAARIAAPINADAVPIVGLVTMALVVVALAWARGAERSRWRHIVFSLGLAAACCAGVFQVMPMIGPDLANARFLYLPMLGIAAAFACAATPWPRTGIRGMPIAAASALGGSWGAVPENGTLRQKRRRPPAGRPPLTRASVADAPFLFANGDANMAHGRPLLSAGSIVCAIWPKRTREFASNWPPVLEMLLIVGGGRVQGS